MSHIPIHPDCIGRFIFNIHGHTHYNHVMRDGARDFRYVNVCVEHTGYRPVLLNWVLEEARKGLEK